jgi:hypothetical protein
MTRSFDLLGREFSVTIAPIEEDLAGYSVYWDRAIFINEKLDDSARAEAFYHELAHMWLETSGYSAKLGEDLDEGLSQFLGMAICHFLTYNRALPTYPRKDD